MEQSRMQDGNGWSAGFDQSNPRSEERPKYLVPSLQTSKRPCIYTKSQPDPRPNPDPNPDTLGNLLPNK